MYGERVTDPAHGWTASTDDLFPRVESAEALRADEFWQAQQELIDKRVAASMKPPAPRKRRGSRGIRP